MKNILKKILILAVLVTCATSNSIYAENETIGISISDDEKQIKIILLGSSAYEEVSFSVYNQTDGDDDLQYYIAEKNDTDDWQYVVNTNDHGGYGTYTITAYTDGNSVVISTKDVIYEEQIKENKTSVANAEINIYERFINLKNLPLLGSTSIWVYNDEYKTLLNESLNREEPIYSIIIERK